jgi:DNA-directed RNA polymerase subunit RPC12/RpoP
VRILVDPKFIFNVINFLMGIYKIRVKTKFEPNPNSKIRAMYSPRTNTITFINPIETTPYHEYGHAVYHNLQLGYKSDSETFAQRFSTMWLTLNKTNFKCTKCGSQKFIPAKPRTSKNFYDIWLICLNCGQTYQLQEPEKIVRHHNP